MTGNQAVILKALQELIEQRGYSYVHDGQWANTGSVYVRPKGSFSNKIQFAYDFQDGYFTINIFEGRAKLMRGMVENQPGHLRTVFAQYHQGEKIDEMLSFFRRSLPDIAPKDKADLTPEQLERLLNNSEGLFNAAVALMQRLNNLTTEEFSRGGEKKERNALEAVIKSIVEGAA